MSNMQRRLTLLVGCALMAMAISVPAAAADPTTEYIVADTGDPCSGGINGSCQPDASNGFFHLRQYPKGPNVTTCEGGTAEVAVGQYGQFLMEDADYGYCKWNYWITACGADFESQIEGSFATGYRMDMDVCVESQSSPTPRWINVPFEVEVNENGVLTGLTQEKEAFSTKYLYGIAEMHFDLDGNVQAIDLEEEE